ncbi:MAG: hypothetical protein F4X19_01945 [Acidobacteria bacterium]|nr:hypothetical protein [Acidobacteriota bacterium]
MDLDANCQFVRYTAAVDVIGKSPDPYRHAHRVFWTVDIATCHRGPASIQRLQQRYPNLRLIHAPVHASWLNQVEVHFSIVQRKVLAPNDFPSLSALSQRLRQFERNSKA